jgi:DNA-binding NarL/FixJ family response regulator
MTISVAREDQPLSQREAQVMALLLRGLRNKEIAGELGITPETVKNYITNIFIKLGCHNRVQLVIKSLQDAILRDF